MNAMRFVMASTRGLLVCLDRLGRARVPGEQLGPLRTGVDQAVARRSVFERRTQRFRERVRVVDRREEARIAADFAERGDVRRDDGRVRGERLEQGEPEALGAT